jgi:hypothetical protein
MAEFGQDAAFVAGEQLIAARRAAKREERLFWADVVRAIEARSKGNSGRLH